MSNTMSTTLIDTVTGVAGEDTVPVDDPENLGDFLIFRVDVLDGGSPYHRELADQSALESGASSYADLMAACEREPGIYYEVRSAATGGLIHTTQAVHCAPETQQTEPQSAPKTKTVHKTTNTRTTVSTEKEAAWTGQLCQLQMAFS